MKKQQRWMTRKASSFKSSTVSHLRMTFYPTYILRIYWSNRWQVATRTPNKSSTTRACQSQWNKHPLSKQLIIISTRIRTKGIRYTHKHHISSTPQLVMREGHLACITRLCQFRTLLLRRPLIHISRQTYGNRWIVLVSPLMLLRALTALSTTWVLWAILSMIRIIWWCKVGNRLSVLLQEISLIHFNLTASNPIIFPTILMKIRHLTLTRHSSM